MSKMLLAAAALLLSGCMVEDPPRYAHQCYAPACVSRSAVVVKVRTPPPAPAQTPAVRARCPAGRYWHPGRTWWNGHRWIVRRGFCRRIPGTIRRHRRAAHCFFRRGRWVRVWQGWRRVPGRWVCRR